VPELTDEHIEDLFADLRTTEMSQVRPPGVAAARTTVRRRRTVTSVATGLAVIAIAGGIGAVSLRSSGPTEGIADSTVTHQEYSDALLDIRRGMAAAAVDVDPESQGIIVRETLRRDGYSFAHDALRGTYTLNVACVGDGTLTLAIAAGTVAADGVFNEDEADPLQTAAVPCTASGTAQQVVFTVPASGILSIRVTPDATAKGRSAFAYRADISAADRLTYQGIVQDAVRIPAGATVVSSMAGFIGDGGGSRDLGGGAATPGAYSATAACTGSGTVTVRIRLVPTKDLADFNAGTVVGQRTIVCGPTPDPSTLTFTTPAGRALSVELDPDADAAGRSAVAYKLARA
jgi:hypothetical protein